MKNWSPYTFIFFALLVAMVALQNYAPYDPLRPQDPPIDFSASAVSDQRNTAGDPFLSDDTRQHILYGSESGGGHHHSANKPCKTEFPENWDETKIIETVKKLAANDNANWRKEDNGYYVSEQPYEGLDIRVVLDREGDDIVTAYPTNLPRNECDEY